MKQNKSNLVCNILKVLFCAFALGKLIETIFFWFLKAENFPLTKLEFEMADGIHDWSDSWSEEGGPLRGNDTSQGLATVRSLRSISSVLLLVFLSITDNLKTSIIFFSGPCGWLVQSLTQYHLVSPQMIGQELQRPSSTLKRRPVWGTMKCTCFCINLISFSLWKITQIQTCTWNPT